MRDDLGYLEIVLETSILLRTVEYRQRSKVILYIRAPNLPPERVLLTLREDELKHAAWPCHPRSHPARNGLLMSINNTCIKRRILDGDAEQSHRAGLGAYWITFAM